MSERSLRFYSWWTPGLGVTVCHYCIHVHDNITSSRVCVHGTVHWIVSDCDLGKVSVYTPNRGCVGLHVVWIIYRC